MTPEQDVEVSENSITLHSLSHPVVACKFNRAISDLLRIHGNAQKIEVLFVISGPVYPNVAVPISNTISQMREIGIDVDAHVVSGPRSLGSIITPMDFSDSVSVDDLFSSIWRFQVDNIYKIVTKVVEKASELIEFSPGSLESVEWMLNEVMDNVPEHSERPDGHLMIQFHKETKRFVVCIGDTGVGIYNRFQQSKKHRVHNIDDAITFAIRRGVTSTDEDGRGNGLFGLCECVDKNGGRVRITSSGKTMELISGQSPRFHYADVVVASRPGTVIDFQVDCSRGINVGMALGVTPIYSEIKLQKMENAIGEVVFKVSDLGLGYATRTSGQASRNRILNLMNEGAQRIVIDFDSIGIISSSYADEVIGKLLAKFGFSNFSTVFRLANMCEPVRQVIDSVMMNRMINMRAGINSEEQEKKGD